jgi:hypothetical protein
MLLVLVLCSKRQQGRAADALTLPESCRGTYRQRQRRRRSDQNTMYSKLSSKTRSTTRIQIDQLLVGGPWSYPCEMTS